MKTKLRIALFVVLVLSFCCDKKSTNPQPGEIDFVITDHLLPGSWITSIAFDRTGGAWLGTFRQGLIHYTDKGTNYNSKNTNLPDSLVLWDVAVDYSNNVWCGTGIGLLKFDGNKFTVYDTANSPIPSDFVQAIAVDYENAVWVAANRFREGGMARFDGQNWEVFTPENSPLPGNGVRDIVVDSYNQKWVAVNGSVGESCVLKYTENQWFKYNPEDNGINPYYFSNLTVREEGQVFVSMDYGLSSYYDLNRPNIIYLENKHWQVANPVDEKGESLGYVGQIAVDLAGNLWATLFEVEDKHLAVFDGVKWHYNKPDFPLNWGRAMEVDSQNRMWIGGGDGVFVVELKQVN